jgi:hypothetical protein
MAISFKSIVACGCLGAVVMATAACSPRRIPPTTVSDLMEDRVMLDGVLMKCNQNKVKARTDVDCVNARIAIGRLASQRDNSADEAKHNEAFERSREQLRMAQEKLRQEQEAKIKVDVYHLPLVPVEQPPPPAPTATSSGNTSPPVANQTTPQG